MEVRYILGLLTPMHSMSVLLASQGKQARSPLRPRSDASASPTRWQFCWHKVTLDHGAIVRFRKLDMSPVQVWREEDFAPNAILGW